MILSEQTKILAGMILLERKVGVINYAGDPTVVISMGQSQYVIDPYASDIMRAWLDLTTGDIVPNTTQQELYKMGLGDDQYRKLLKKIMDQIRSGAKKPTTDIPPDVPDNLREWLEKYVDTYETLTDRGDLFLLPHSLGTVFKNHHANYRMYDNPSQDFIAIMPTPKGMIYRGKTSDKGVYVLRREAHRDSPQYGIRAGSPYTNYILDIESVVGNNLLSVRSILEELNLGIFYRRDHRLLTVTEWIPSNQFQSFDELKEWSEAIVEQIRRIANNINDEFECECQWCGARKESGPGICPKCHRFPTTHDVEDDETDYNNISV